jgi:hypothetical protein
MHVWRNELLLLRTLRAAEREYEKFQEDQCFGPPCVYWLWLGEKKY